MKFFHIFSSNFKFIFFYSVYWLKRSKMRLLSLDEEDTLLFNCQVNRTLYMLYRDNTDRFTLMWEQQVISLVQYWKVLSFGCGTVIWRVIQKFLDWVENEMYGLLLFAIPSELCSMSSISVTTGSIFWTDFFGTACWAFSSCLWISGTMPSFLEASKNCRAKSGEQGGCRVATIFLATKFAALSKVCVPTHCHSD